MLFPNIALDQLEDQISLNEMSNAGETMDAHEDGLKRAAAQASVDVLPQLLPSHHCKPELTSSSTHCLGRNFGPSRVSFRKSRFQRGRRGAVKIQSAVETTKRNSRTGCAIEVLREGLSPRSAILLAQL